MERGIPGWRAEEQVCGRQTGWELKQPNFLPPFLPFLPFSPVTVYKQGSCDMDFNPSSQTLFSVSSLASFLFFLFLNLPLPRYEGMKVLKGMVEVGVVQLAENIQKFDDSDLCLLCFVEKQQDGDFAGSLLVVLVVGD